MIIEKIARFDDEDLDAIDKVIGILMSMEEDVEVYGVTLKNAPAPADLYTKSPAIQFRKMYRDLQTFLDYAEHPEKYQEQL